MTWPLNEAALKYYLSNPISQGDFLVELEKRRSDSPDGACLLEFKGNEGLEIRLHLQGEVAQNFPKNRLDTICVFIGRCLPLMNTTEGRILLAVSDGVYFNFAAPTLVFSRHKNCPQNILFPDTDFILSAGYELPKAETELALINIPWYQRKQILFWRGADSSPKIKDSLNICERTTLCKRTKDSRNPELFDCLLSSVTQPDQLDFVRKERLLAYEPVPYKEFLNYRYLLDIDGWSNSWSGCFRKLLSGSLLFKVESNWEQWYYDQIKPWEHYIPIKKDLSDLEEKVIWAIEHDSQAQQIAYNARQTALGITFQGTVEQAAQTLSTILGYSAT